MRNIKTDFFYLLQLGLWGKTAEQRVIHFSKEEWKAIYIMAVKQTVQGIIFDGIQLLPIDQQPPKDIQIPWLMAVVKIEKSNKIQLAQLNDILNFFNQNNLPFILQKGQGIAKLYRNRYHRICGDYDLWFGSEEKTEKANKLIEEIGIKVERGFKADSIYNWFGTPAEHHFRLVELTNPFKEKDLRNWEIEEFNKSTFVPTPCANLLLQITHILKHQLNEGIGLRQICDLAVSLTCLEYDKKELEALCRKYGVFRWTKLLISLIHQTLGVPLEKMPFPNSYNPTILINEIWEAGNFGHGDTRFGDRPEGKWKSKLYTANIICRKTKLFFYYIPEECFWRISTMVWARIKACICTTKT